MVVATIENALDTLRKLIKVQGSNGNWDHDPYMYGLLNGMVLAESLLTGDSPEFRDAPPKWRGKSREEKALETLRDANPALQKAWEEYKIIEGLVAGTEGGPDARR